MHHLVPCGHFCVVELIIRYGRWLSQVHPTLQISYALLFYEFVSFYITILQR